MEAIIDARRATETAIAHLLKRKTKPAFRNLQVSTLRQFLRQAESEELRLSRKEKELICDQAIIVLEQFYAHLPFKRARYAVDPIQRLRLLRAELSDIDEQTFHGNVIRAFTALRDVHTIYGLPQPFSGAFSFLPFYVDSYQLKNGHRRFVVTEILEGFDPDPGNFELNCEIVAWSGVPIGTAVDLLAQNIPGGNAATRVFRGTMRLTVRSLTTSLPPVEELVFVHYKPFRPHQKEVRERIIAVPWHVGIGIRLASLLGTGRTLEVGKRVSNSSCIQLADLAIVKDALWAHGSVSKKRDSIADSVSLETAFPDVLEVHHSSEVVEGAQPWRQVLTDTVAHSLKRFGYIRIKKFPDTFGALGQEFQRILELFEENSLAQDGLIIDIRSNPGGNIVEAECLLQMLTPKKIQPARFHFPNTEEIQSLMATIATTESIQEAKDGLPIKQVRSVNHAVSFFDSWIDGVLKGAASGSSLTDGRSITPVEEANEVGQVYQGPVTLLTDAGTYSAADIFSAGFQDHKIGPIIGLDDNTGGGGASVWKHDEELISLGPLISRTIEPLPNGAALGLAITRSSRVGSSEGFPVEDLGVRSDIRYKRTLVDLGPVPEDLLRFACKTLAKLRKYTLWMDSLRVERKDEKWLVRIDYRLSNNMHRMVVLLDGQPETVIAIEDQVDSNHIVLETKKQPKVVEVQGYIWQQSGAGRHYELVASDKKRAKLKPAASGAHV